MLLEQILSQIIFGRLHYYEFILIKKYKKSLLQKSQTKVFKQKKLQKTCSKWTSKKTRAFWVVASNYYIILNMFEHTFTFYISRITWDINYNWSLLKAVNVLYIYVQIKRTNQNCSLLKISQSITNEWRICDGNGK